MTELGAQIQRKLKEYSLLLNESETLRRLAHRRAQKMSREEALNWLGVIYELLKRYDTLVQELEALNNQGVQAVMVGDLEFVGLKRHPAYKHRPGVTREVEQVPPRFAGTLERENRNIIVTSESATKAKTRR
jgi:hypothetical protein